jgi:lysophospholipase
LRLANISGFDIENFTSDLNETSIPKIGLAISGGGTQSGVGGLGIWEAFDARSSAAQGSRTGGIVQLLMYLTGLSGGGAVTVSTIASNNFTTLDGIQQAVNFSVDYARGPGGNANESNYFEGIFEEVGAKAGAGFPVSVADTFGRFWATYLPQDQSYSNYSDIALPATAFSNGDAPMPTIALTEVIVGVSPSIG